jgi:hypothetical protein
MGMMPDDIIQLGVVEVKDRIENARIQLRLGEQFPYDNRSNCADPALKAALGVLWNLTGRRGIDAAFADIHLSVREIIVESLADIIREAYRQE